MNTDEIVAMAKEVDIDVDAWGVMGVLCLSGFAALVAAKEREACAQVCDEGAQKMLHAFKREGAARCAAAIRARGAK